MPRNPTAPRLIVSNDQPDKAAPTVLPKKLRAEWMDVMSVDGRLSAVDFRVACVVGGLVNVRTGITYASRGTLATRCGLSTRAVERSIARLAALGYLIIERSDHGFFLNKDGKKVLATGGRGKANGFRIAFERSTVESTFDSKNLERAYDVFVAQTSTPQSLNVDSPVDPTLNLPSEDNSTRAHTCAREAAPSALGAAGERLRAKVGAEVFRSWFGQVAFEGASDGGLRLSAATEFVRKSIDQRFSGAILAAWAPDYPGLSRLTVSVRHSPRGGQ